MANKIVNTISLIVVSLILLILIVNTDGYLQSFLIGVMIAIVLYGTYMTFTSYEYKGGDENTQKCLSNAYIKYTKSMDECDEKNCRGSDNYKECVASGRSMRRANGYINSSSNYADLDFSNRSNLTPNSNSNYHKPDANIYHNSAFPTKDKYGYAVMPSSDYGTMPDSKLGRRHLYETTDMSMDEPIVNPYISAPSKPYALLTSMQINEYETNKPLPSIPKK